MIDYLADQLGVADISQIKQYTERRQTQFDHQDEIKKVYGLREFSAVEAEFTSWVDARAWNTGDGKKSIFVSTAPGGAGCDGMGGRRARRTDPSAFSQADSTATTHRAARPARQRSRSHAGKRFSRPRTTADMLLAPYASRDGSASVISIGEWRSIAVFQSPG